MKEYTKDQLITALKAIREQGFIPNARPGNAGGVGNTLEDLLGIEENNLPIANASEWELKTQRLGSTALNTLFHSEPSPTALHLVPAKLLPLYGWKHSQASKKYPAGELSFRQTIHGLAPSSRGFRVGVDEENRKVLISFDAESVIETHSAWLKNVESRIGLTELEPQPYWGFDDLFHKAGTKLGSTFFVQAEVMRKNGLEFYHYKRILMLQKFSLKKFLNGIKEGFVLVDFDARSGHNHGTKFRLRKNRYPDLYDSVKEI